MNQPAQLEEYKMLRTDIQQRIRFRFQLFSLLLTALGALLAYGARTETVTIYLVYPLIAFFLTMSWMHQGVVMVKIARYLREELEPKVKGLDWEAYIQQDSSRFSGFSLIGFFAAGGFILFSQWMMLGLALSKGMPQFEALFDKIILITAIIASILNLVFLAVYSRLKR